MEQMKIELVVGARKRTNEGWQRVDRVYIDNRPIPGQIVVEGFRKREHSVITRLGMDERGGRQVYWLMHKAGLVQEETAIPA
jgi:hypothetical protein